MVLVTLTSIKNDTNIPNMSIEAATAKLFFPTVSANLLMLNSNLNIQGLRFKLVFCLIATSLHIGHISIYPIKNHTDIMREGGIL